MLTAASELERAGLHDLRCTTPYYHVFNYLVEGTIISVGSPYYALETGRVDAEQVPDLLGARPSVHRSAG